MHRFFAWTTAGLAVFAGYANITHVYAWARAGGQPATTAALCAVTPDVLALLAILRIRTGTRGAPVWAALLFGAGVIAWAAVWATSGVVGRAVALLPLVVAVLAAWLLDLPVTGRPEEEATPVAAVVAPEPPVAVTAAVTTPLDPEPLAVTAPVTPPPRQLVAAAEPPRPTVTATIPNDDQTRKRDILAAWPNIDGTIDTARAIDTAHPGLWDTVRAVQAAASREAKRRGTAAA